MKIAIFLFVAAFAFFFGVPAGLASLEYDEYLDKGASSKLVRENMRRYTDVVVPTGLSVERELNIGYTQRISLAEGIMLIHDESLGSRVIARGPENVLDRLEPFRFPSPYISFRFNRPIKLTEPIEIRMNLSDHTVGKLNLIFPCSDKDDWVNFTTLSALKEQKLTIVGGVKPGGTLMVDVETLQLSARNRQQCQAEQTIEFSGRADEVLLPIRGDRFVLSDLASRKFYQEQDYMSGRKIEMPRSVPRLEMIYNTSNTLDANGNSVALRPDTLVVGQNTELDIKYRDGETLEPLKTIVIIRQ